MKKWLKRILWVCIGILAYVGALYLLQDHLLFFPDIRYVPPQETGVEKFREISLVADDGNPIRSWYAVGDKTKPAVLFLHGNAGQIATFAGQLDVLVQAGYGVLAMEYRSFARVPGSIRQDVIFADAAKSFDFLQEQGYPKIVVYGYSFGAAFASGLTSLRPADGLILTAPFYSLKREVGDKPVPFAKQVLRDEYPSYRYVEKFTQPLLIITSKNDRLISWQHAQDLFKLSPSAQKEIFVLEGPTHNSLYFEGSNLPYILKFLANLETSVK